jgi:hypothetical protein
MMKRLSCFNVEVVIELVKLIVCNLTMNIACHRDRKNDRFTKIFSSCRALESIQTPDCLTELCGY